MKTVLISAYALSPGRGSEPGMGWSWCSRIAASCQVHIITEPEFRDEIEQALPGFKYADRMHIHYIPVTPRVRTMCRNQGDWRFYWYYRKWQKKAYRLAVEICAREQLDVIHQLNMVGFREPGFLWKIPGVRYVWGPIGGMTMTPISYFRREPLKERLKMRIKNLLNSLQIHHSIWVRKAVERADAIICATGAEQNVVQNYFGKPAVVLSETGLFESPYVGSGRKESSGFNLLWVGRFLRSKELGLALETVSRLTIPGVRLHVVGTGSEKEVAQYHSLADNLGLSGKIVWHGQVSRDEVQRMMAQEADLFFFTSVYEATSSVVLEAISNHLPVVCFDACGFGPIVDETVGRKISLTTPEQSVRDFSAVIESLYADPELRRRLSGQCAEKVRQLSWDGKMARLMQMYEA